MLRRVLLFLVCLVPLSAEANLPLTPAQWGLFAFGTGSDDYRIGDEWGKKPVTIADLEHASPAFRRAALATAKTGGATGFYLGKFAGYYVMATNHHVFPAAWGCLGSTLRFPLLNISVRCSKFFGSWPEIDLALFAVDLSSADAAKLDAVAGNFAFREDLKKGEELLTIGFGIADNPNREEVAEQDADCKVFSGDGEYRLMGDPDEFNPGDYQAWSFSHGCDCSHGDSGSAMVDRNSGKVVGIIWTGRIPKKPAIQRSDYLQRLFESGGEEIWTELSYAVPAKKMGEFLAAQLNGSAPEDTKTMLRALLQ